MRAYSPGHVTCFFSPVESEDLLRKGSIGTGIRLDRGSEVEITPIVGKEDIVTVNGEPRDAIISSSVMRYFLRGDNHYSLRIINDFPVGQGFGTSASSAVAVGLCCCAMTEMPLSKAYGVAHLAEVSFRGGLGDVAGIRCEGSQPIRKKPGMVDKDGARDTGIKFKKLTAAVLGDPISTPDILNDDKRMSRLAEAGNRAMDEFAEDMTKESLFRIANEFSKDACLETPEVTEALNLLHRDGINAMMCMIGNSIIAEASLEQVRAILPKATLYPCKATPRRAAIIHTR